MLPNMISESGAVFAGIIRHRSSPKWSRRAEADIFEFLILWSDARETWEPEQHIDQLETAAAHQVLTHRLNPTNPRLDEELLASFVGTPENEWLPRREVPVEFRREYWAKIQKEKRKSRRQVLEEERVKAVCGKVSVENEDVDNFADEEDNVTTEEERERKWTKKRKRIQLSRSSLTAKLIIPTIHGSLCEGNSPEANHLKV
ncbi:hypothetical protein CGLO_04174 [Colletotrichum gloeosporioides Cg-14]|uniref:KRAB domain-containing protein n=1 Tax=Colletotrichum gloeosporioides (strain Cg-14) TaxID=1237896 RepID=T0M4W6_COLGC|nr:hypothetical protein CGLO_04174 [Colletotrichum gloeosporioides Cg-14]